MVTIKPLVLSQSGEQVRIDRIESLGKNWINVTIGMMSQSIQADVPKIDALIEWLTQFKKMEKTKKVDAE